MGTGVGTNSAKLPVVATRKRRPRGHIEERPNGTFRAIVNAGTDPLTGRRRTLKETAQTWDAAKKALTRLQNQVDEKRHPRSAITVAQAVDQWMDVAPLAATTRERYEDLIRLYIEPTFGAMPAGKVDAELLERFYAHLTTTCRDIECTGRRRRGHGCRPLKANTVRKIHFIFQAAFARAVRWKYLGTNEAELAEPPEFEPGEPDPPTAEEAATLLTEAWRDPDWGLLLWLTMVTGSRRGEMCGLRWRHLNLDTGVLWLQRSSAHLKTGVQDKRTKTHQGRRIALDSHTVSLLHEHRDRWRERCAALGVQLGTDAFVFSLAPDGSTSPLPRSVSQRYRRLAVRLGLRSTRLHSLRHYSATELIAAGVDVRTVAGRLGHGSGGATTLRTYAGWVSEADRKAAETISAIVPRPDSARRIPRSPYEQLAAGLRASIKDGQLPPGAELPTIAQLANVNGVSTGTAHRAVALLKAEGLVEVQRGRRANVRPLA
jgi:integrase